ncbi:MAG TPA: hypothetical protein VE085_06575 [Burkholderiales bacterium]|nr:hypothetical protein [Burkholderiales bacterium]
MLAVAAQTVINRYLLFREQGAHAAMSLEMSQAIFALENRGMAHGLIERGVVRAGGAKQHLERVLS